MATVLARHDAILPVAWEGINWALVNLGDNTETENASMAELFETINRHLLALSNTRDCFVVNPPSIECVKAHHNMFVRLNKAIDGRTKADNEARLDFAHITPVRRKFATYPVRYYDVKNRWTRRWIELYLYGLSNMAQLAEANTWTNDWNTTSAKEMKKPFQEAYRLMCIELFDVDLSVAKDKEYRLAPVQFETYSPSTLIPTYEWQEHPFTNFSTEDVLADGARRHVPVSDHINDAPNPGFTSGVGVPQSGGGAGSDDAAPAAGGAGSIIQ